MLTMPNQQENLSAAQQLREMGFSCKMAAIAKYPDEIELLRKAGVDAAFNLYAEAGNGFADHVCEELIDAESKGSA